MAYRDELSAAWKIFTPILHAIDRGEITPLKYPAGALSGYTGVSDPGFCVPCVCWAARRQCCAPDVAQPTSSICEVLHSIDVK